MEYTDDPNATPAAGSDSSGAASGASASNTAPHNCNSPVDLIVLRTGVDTLQLSYQGELREEPLVRLDALKKVAQADSASERTYAQFQIGPRVFSVLPKGTGLFRYVLNDPAFRISLSSGKGSLPVAHVQIRSEIPTRIGPRLAEEELRGIISELAVISEAPTVSRIDACVDFSTSFDLESISRHDWVTRAKRISQFVENGVFTGWSIGLGGAISGRLYDKTEEIRVKNKSYFEEIWRDLGWDGNTPVWRLEFQVKRDALRNFKELNTSDYLLLSGQLWPYLTTEWLRLTRPSEVDETRSRWPTHPLWEQLQAVTFGDGDPPEYQRVGLRGHPSYDWMFRTGASAILTLMALKGVEDLEEGIFTFIADYLEYLDGRADFADAHAEAQIDIKLREIRRKYNLALNERPDFMRDPVTSALLRHYRKGKDGG